MTAAPAAARNPPAAPEYRTGDPDKFFDTLYPPVHALAQRLGIDETWLLGLSAYESGWLNAHNRALNNPFGATHYGGPNVAYSSLGDAVAYWEKKYGPVVRGASSPAGLCPAIAGGALQRANPGWSEMGSPTIGTVSHISRVGSRKGGPMRPGLFAAAIFLSIVTTISGAANEIPFKSQHYNNSICNSR